uniref:hypothetical protein n=1 Tax=Geminicoccus flavidas TaxID=2506407 RepID=UPI001F18A147
GQDKLLIRFQAERNPDGSGGGTYLATFQDLDTDGNGTLGIGDAGVSLEAVDHGGQTKTSLMINAEHFDFQQLVPTTGTITLFGVTTLTAADIDSTTPGQAFFG